MPFFTHALTMNGIIDYEQLNQMRDGNIEENILLPEEMFTGVVSAYKKKFTQTVRFNNLTRLEATLKQVNGAPDQNKHTIIVKFTGFIAPKVGKREDKEEVQSAKSNLTYQTLVANAKRSCQ